jgi:hypothetical protein
MAGRAGQRGAQALTLADMNPIRLVRRYVKAHHVSRAALVAAGIGAAFLAFIAGAAVRLLIGPVSLGPFAGTLADALDRAVPGMSLKYDQAAVEWERDEGRVNLVILGTRVFDREGRIIAQAPKADIVLAAGPFLHGKLEVKRIGLVGVQLTLVRTVDGGLRLGIGKDSQEGDILKRISDALKANHGNTTSLESFAVRRARLAFYDEATKLFVVAPRTDFLLRRADHHLLARVDAAVEISGHPAHVTADITFPPDKGLVTADAAITGFEVQALAANSPAFAAIRDTALKLDLRGSFVIDGPRLASARFTASASGAFIVPELKDGRVNVSTLKAHGRYDATQRLIVLENASIQSDKVKAHLQGKLGFRLDDAGDIVGLRADLRMSQLALAWKGVFAEPVQFQLVDLAGAWDRAGKDFVIERFGVNGSPFLMQASGHVTLADSKSPAVDVKGTVSTLSMRDLVRFWPVGAAPGARAWVEANMKVGTIGPATFELHFPAGVLDESAVPADAITAKFAVKGAEVNYIDGLTHLTEVEGTATITGTSFTADVPSAKIGPLAVRAARFTVPDFNRLPAGEGLITGHIQGAMPDVLTLVDMGNLRYPSKFGINPAASKGDTGLDLTVKLPLLKTVSIDQVSIGIKAQSTGFSVALGPHTQLTDGNIAFQIDNNKLHALGTAGLGGSATRLNLDWTEDFNTAKAATTKVAVKGTLDEVARATLGVGMKGYLKGPIGITGTLTGHRGNLVQGNLTLDLTPASVMVDLVAVNKPAGFPMSARIALGFTGKSAMESLAVRVTGPGTSVTANVRYDASERMVQLQAPVMHLGPQNDFSLNVTRGDGGIDIAIRGHSLDGSRMGRRGSGDDQNLDEPFHINAKLDRLMLRDGVAMTSYSLDIAGVADRPSTMTFSAALSKNATVTASIAPADGGRRATLSTNDMGTLLQGLFAFESIKGGKLDVSATLPGRAVQPANGDGPDFFGKASLKDFRVLNQPFLARLFSAGSLGGLANLMQGQGIAVDSLDVPFSSKGGVISVHDVRATGPAIGISADGYIDRPKNTIAIKGSLVPLFGLNSVLGNIPILGNVLTSKEGEGIIGITYDVSGNADEPNVTVNPLSALAPGFLRRIFEGKMPVAPNATPPTPAPKPPATDPKKTRQP